MRKEERRVSKKAKRKEAEANAEAEAEAEAATCSSPVESARRGRCGSGQSMEGKPKPKPPSAFPHRDQRGVSAGADQLSRGEAIRYFQEAVRRCEDENIVDAVLMKQAEA